MGLEQKINYQLNKHPGVKRVVKSAYQHAMYAVSPKIKSEGNITRISPDDSAHEYFFGYYDKSPWDITDRYVLCLSANDTWSDVSPHETADILLIDTALPESDPNRVKKIAETNSWNVQQSCMLQWLGPDFSSRILFNDYRDERYVAVIKEIESGAERIIPAPIYTVSTDGRTALTLDFSRLYNLRPGYGYYNVEEKTKGVALPDATAVWKINLETGEVSDLLSYKDFASFQPRPEMQEVGAVHKVNHLMISPNGQRFMVLYRWFIGERKYTRLITCNVDGTDMYVLSDDDMVSHCFWKDDEHILAFENKKGPGTGYFLMKDKTQEYKLYWSELTGDGHPSYSPDRSHIVTDSYPDRTRIQYIRVMKDEDSQPEVIAKVFSPFKYDNDTRCDLHPRWNHEGNKICFDSVFEGHRGLYYVSIDELCFPVLSDGEKRTRVEKPKYTIITPMYNSFDLMPRYFNSLAEQTYKNFEVIIIDDRSTDGSYEKLCNYKDTCPIEIRIYRTDKNNGPGPARNIGIEKARGEWITFIDNDDWVDINLLSKIDEIIDSNQVNAVIYDYNLSDGKKSTPTRSMYIGDTGKVSLSNCMIYARNHTVGKFYNLSKCKGNNIKFPSLKRCEDIAFVARALQACGEIYYLHEPLYYYFQRRNSLSNDKTLDESDLIRAFAILEKELGNTYRKEIAEKSVPDLLYGTLLIMCKNNDDNDKIKGFIDAYEKKYPNWRKSTIIKQLGKPKELFLLFASHGNINGMKALAKVHSRLVGN